MQLFKRSVYCGHINENYLEKEIFLSGWVHRRRDHGGIIFIDLRDRTGLMQLVIDPNIRSQLGTDAHHLRSEFVISVRGKVVKRAPEAVNKNISTGKFELKVDNLSIVNKAKALPFQLDEADKVEEDIRLKYRYLDLRRKKMHDYIKLRHNVIHAIRSYLHDQEFYEIETPILSKSTPEGARDFLVPSRLQPGKFYALPQSPQIYKQLIVASGMEKYFQIARCFRDEDLRANRQPEFTQLDIEMSFIQESDVQNITEEIITLIWEKILEKKLSLPFPRYTFEEIFFRFGTDKPDMRFDLEITEVTNLFADTELGFLKSVVQKNGRIGSLRIQHKNFSRSELDHWIGIAIKKFGVKGLLYIRFNNDGTTDSPVSKFLPKDFFTQLRKYYADIDVTDTLFLIAGEYKKTWTALNNLRLALGNSLDLIKTNEFNFLWVTDFPLLEWDEDENRWYAMHHPFTSPRKEWESRKPEKMIARAYDLVCNGEELGGGSIRIHNAQIQSKIFELLGINKKIACEKFGFLLEAQQLGFPPHGGIAIGLDRLIMIIANTNSIRDVIAFPKTQSGNCPMMETPSDIDEVNLRKLYLKSTYSTQQKPTIKEK